MELDFCPNCSGQLTPFPFNCGYGKDLEICREYLCLSCEYCSYTFNDHDAMIQKIKDLITGNSKIYSSSGKLKNRTFLVTCNDEIIFDYDIVQQQQMHNEDYPKLIAKAPSFEEIQSELNKKYELKLDDIIGFDDIKNLLQETVSVKYKKKVNLLIAGHPGTAKTVFLTSIKEELEAQGAKCQYIDCANLTGAGIVDVILTTYVDYGNKIDFLLLDEIDKVDRNHQRSFLNMLQTGIVKSTKKTDQREAKVSFSAIATANDIDRIYKALFDRFLSVYLPAYDRDQFFSIAEAILRRKYHYSENFAKTMTLKVWQTSKSMRRIDDIAIMLQDEIDDKTRLRKMNLIIETMENRKSFE